MTNIHQFPKEQTDLPVKEFEKARGLWQAMLQTPDESYTLFLEHLRDQRTLSFADFIYAIDRVSNNQYIRLLFMSEIDMETLQHLSDAVIDAYPKEADIIGGFLLSFKFKHTHLKRSQEWMTKTTDMLMDLSMDLD